MKKRTGRKTGPCQDHLEKVPKDPECLDTEATERAQHRSDAEEDVNDVLVAKTPVRAAAAPGAELSWEQMISQQLQTPERHRSTNLASWLSSPPHIGSPCLFNSPEPVPLFHPSPRRNGLTSPPQQSGVNSFGNIFASPVRGAGELQPSDLLRFETPSSKPAFGGLLSPSPRRSRRLASGGQHSKRAVSLEAVNWLPDLGRQLGLPSKDGLGDVQAFVHSTEEDEGDLVKDLLQSPGPKEVQQMADSRIHTRSRHHQAPTTAGAAAAIQHACKPPAHSRRRALDFSRASGAESMQNDLHHAVSGRKSSRHGSSGRAEADATADGLHGDSLHPKLQPHLPLLPLDLSAVEKANPEAAAAAAGSAGVTPRRGRSGRHGLDSTLTSPRSALDAAAAMVGSVAMEALRNSGLALHHMCTIEQSDHLGCLADVARPAHSNLGSQEHDPAMAAAAADRTGGISLMVPVGTATSAAGSNHLQEQQQQAEAQQVEAGLEQIDYAKSRTGTGCRRKQQQLQHTQDDDDDYMIDAEDVEQQQQDAQEDEEPAACTYSRRRSAAAAAAMASSHKPWNLRPHGKKQQVPDLQPSRRSRRIAGDTPAEQQGTAAAAADDSSPGSSGRKKRQHSRLQQQQQQQEAEGEQQNTDNEHEQQQEQQTQVKVEPVGAFEAVLAAAADGHTAEQEAEQQQQQVRSLSAEVERPRSRSSGRRGKGRKAGKPRRQHADDTGDEDEDYCAGGSATGGSESRVAVQQQFPGLPAVTGLQQLMQSSGLQQVLQLPNGALVPIGATPDKNGLVARLGGSAASSLGPGTPDEVRLAHVVTPTMPPMRTCHCKKSQCLKLYCDCFGNGTFCSGCACVDCRNVESNTQEVMLKRTQILQRDPNAFANKLAATADSVSLTNRKGCKCKRSHCLKKYCECYQMGVHCGDLCKCSDCQNIDYGASSNPPSGALTSKQLLQRSLHSNSSTTTQQRLQHTATVPQYWQLGQQPLASGISSGGGTPVAAAGANSAFAQAPQTIILRMAGGGNTPSSTQMLCLPIPGSQGQTVSVLPVQLPGSISQGHTSAGAPATVANTPNPPGKSAGALHDRKGLSLTAKPLLPQFMKAAAAAAAAAAGDGGGTAAAADASGISAAATTAAAGDEAAAHLLSDEELPTPGQLATEPAAAAAGQLGGSPTTCATSNDAGGNAAAVHAVHAVASPSQMSSPRLALGSAVASGKSPVARLASPAAAAAATCSSSGGMGSGSPKAAIGLGSTSSKGRHRLAATSRATDEHPFMQQQQQQHGIYALTAGSVQPDGADVSASAAVAEINTSTRRQLVQVKEEEDADTSCWARTHVQAQQQQQVQVQVLAARNAMAPPSVHWQRSVKVEPSAVAAATPVTAGLETPAQAAAAAEGGEQLQDTSPVQHVSLGPNGPVIPVSQRALAAAVQTVALSSQAAAEDDSRADSAQTVGVLMTVTSEHGVMQQYFLPVASHAAAAAVAAGGSSLAPLHATAVPTATAAPTPADATAAADTKDQKQQQQQAPPYQLRRRHTNSLQGTGLSQLPAADNMVIDQPSGARHVQQTEPAGTGTVGVAAAGTSRTPQKQRSTPVKRKADAEHEDVNVADGAASPCVQLQLQSPAKLQHQLDSPGQQHKQQLQHDAQQLQQEHLSPPERQQATQVLLSPVKRTRSGGLVVVQQNSIQQGQQQQQQLRIPHVPAAGWTIQADNRPTNSCNNNDNSCFNSPMGEAAVSSGVAFQPLAAPTALQQQQLMQLQLQSQGMQLFFATMPDGSTIPFMAPMGTDASKLLGCAASIQAGGLMHSDASQSQQQLAGFGAEAAQEQQCLGLAGGSADAGQLQDCEQQQQSGGSGALAPFQRQSSSSSGGHSPSAKRGDLFGTASPHAKVLLSPRDTHTRDGSLFKFSPGCTTVFSPTKAGRQ